MDFESIAIIISAILGLLGATWGGYAVAKGQVNEKLKQASELLTTVKDALEDDSLSKEELKDIVDKATALITFKKEKTDA